MQNFLQNFSQYFGLLRSIGIADIIDILIVSVGFYWVLKLIWQSNAQKIFYGIGLIFILLGLSSWFNLHTMNFILRTAVEVGLIALVILFQPELRRMLEKIGTLGWLGALLGSDLGALTEEKAVSQIVMACKDMSESRTGALIVFERDNPLEEQIRNGTILRAEISAALLKNIFFVNTPLHDGAVIIRDSRIEAAGCMLPLSGNNKINKSFGMRHRAGLGMSESSDAVSLMVSEETGGISLAVDGQIKPDLTPETLEKTLNALLSGKKNEEKPRKPFAALKKGERK